MIITGMDHFQSVCKKKLVEWYNNNGQANTPQTPPTNANGSGELYLTKLDKKILGVGNRIGYTNPYSGLIQTEEEA